MTLHEKIHCGLKDALRAKDAARLRTIRSMLTAFTNELVATGRKPGEVLGDTETLLVIKRLAGQRKDSIEQFQKGGRDDLALREQEERAVLEAYLPKMLSQEEIEPVVRKKKEELGVTEKSQAGRLIGAVMKDLAGKTDGALVKAVVERLLA